MRKAVASVSFLIALASGSSAQDVPGSLTQVGALNCVARLVEEAPPADVTELECQLRLQGPQMKARHYSGKIVKSGLWLVDPGPVRLAWRVLAPTELLNETALEGEYDTAPSKDYNLSGAEKNMLFGGAEGSIALQLMAPPLDGINPSTRMILRTASQSEN